MATKNIQMRPVGAGDYADVLHPETNTDMVIHKVNGKKMAEIVDKVAPGDWIDLPVSGDWVIREPKLQIRKEGDMVRIYGAIQNTKSSGGLAFTLPSGYRPLSTVLQLGIFASSGAHILSLYSDGRAFPAEVANNFTYINTTFKWK